MIASLCNAGSYWLLIDYSIPNRTALAPLPQGDARLNLG